MGWRAEAETVDGRDEVEEAVGGARSLAMVAGRVAGQVVPADVVAGMEEILLAQADATEVVLPSSHSRLLVLVSVPSLCWGE